MFLQTNPLAVPEVFYGPVSRVNPRRCSGISPWCGWGIPVLRFNSIRDGDWLASTMYAFSPIKLDLG